VSIWNEWQDWMRLPNFNNNNNKPDKSKLLPNNSTTTHNNNPLKIQSVIVVEGGIIGSSITRALSQLGY